MSPSPEERPTIQQSADSHVDEVLTRRKASRNLRTEALARHSQTITIQTRIVPVQRLTAEPAAAAPAVSTSAQTAGYLLAVGDSWFDYPIHDVLTKLEDHFGYNIESCAHKGDPIESMVSRVGQLDKFARNLDKIKSLGVTPKAILISGGGDDIAGDEFGMLLNNIDLHIDSINSQVIDGVIDTRIATAYRLMVASLNTYCQQDLGRTFPILMHGYDYPVPDGRGFLGGWGPLPGPWLKPGFDEKLYSDLAATTQMMKTLIDRFNAMLARLVTEPAFAYVHYVDLRGTLSNGADYKDFWANELHPTGGGLFGGRDGFLAVATKLQDVLKLLP